MLEVTKDSLTQKGAELSCLARLGVPQGAWSQAASPGDAPKRCRSQKAGQGRGHRALQGAAIRGHRMRAVGFLVEAGRDVTPNTQLLHVGHQVSPCRSLLSHLHSLVLNVEPLWQGLEIRGP